MKASFFTITLILLLINVSCSKEVSTDDFLECLSHQFNNYSSISNHVYTQINSSFSSILLFSIQNLRFASDSTPKPQVIITPEHEFQIPPIIYCAKNKGLQIRTRSGGHDLEGLSYVSQVPFVIIDLIKLSEITIDVGEKTAWVQSGATLGSLYYMIAEKSPILGFPGGVCPTIGVGGHISGGGYGPLMRKYGLAADQVIDARIIDVNGRILDRKSMGEDLFWAIRGGGGASFGVIVAWKVKLVDVPKTVTVFKVDKKLEQNATQLFHRWQYIASELDKDLRIGIAVAKVNTTQQRKNQTINISFISLFLGRIDRLLPTMQENFPELGLVREDCIETSWIGSVLFHYGFPIESPKEVLLNRSESSVTNIKGKSNYVQKPIPKKVLEGMWSLFREAEAADASLIISPYGGRMAEISESTIPFPHRGRNLYKIHHVVFWDEDDAQKSDKYISWTRRFDKYLTPFVTMRPRGAYLNYRDLDLGVNNVVGNTSYAQASVWGKRYFKGNFDRLVRVKTVVDPGNFFRNEQSIPPLHSIV
ncbi:tetrahydrocannabinolic acid synthase-like [Salvia hispanica]|uniref:tetrahydrocannabinolic acid synthase-like n=1 Tax=Salvia hispanica TaxID=49212 RepID=UPI002009109C|nr:tetrahydrocannabinolic acid synthase-like [Salvia hispanica]